ncbi:Manganese/iron superoxide dismutase [Caldithrix abyssi DSM 13497]|uniref:Superoxide dismutase n=1 Tax=Caldithrix abyssi DSM 13497 TaxID=880073 RepID=H1XW73_CALAY|nr:superoxide dismutase [Caldithrix abyssi]APF19032.1 superoxide dismutase, Fe-Mn family [Caldithrix abyssi DSM 13497]EHO42978.1 Manganese/iron superoxide dismutase [Caldithrix abyssi DSM 13497]
MPHQLPELGFSYNALEPFIDAMTMEIHHTKHHGAYVNNLNAALDKHPDLHTKSIEKLLGQLSTVPADIQTAVRNNGGGHWNHSFFWALLKKNENGEPVGELAKAIDSAFGSFDAFKEQFHKAGMTRFGSGWAWLIVNDQKQLVIGSTPNQDNPLMDISKFRGTPVLGVDVWEHAYYLKYQNRRNEYLNNFFNVINWEKVEENFLQAL